MYQVGVIGDRDSIIGFKALGMTVVEAETATEAAHHIRMMIENSYAVIYITETLAEEIHELLQEQRDRRLPAIIPIPSIMGTTGLGMRQVSESVRKAVGIDIFNTADQSDEE